MNFFLSILLESWRLLQQASVYVLFGLLVAGLMRVFINPGRVAHHLGHGRFSSVFKAAILGIPIPLCSCGVLPAAASLAPPLRDTLLLHDGKHILPSDIHVGNGLHLFWRHRLLNLLD